MNTTNWNCNRKSNVNQWDDIYIINYYVKVLILCSFMNQPRASGNFNFMWPMVNCRSNLFLILILLSFQQHMKIHLRKKIWFFVFGKLYFWHYCSWTFSFGSFGEHRNQFSISSNQQILTEIDSRKTTLNRSAIKQTFCQKIKRA